MKRTRTEMGYSSARRRAMAISSKMNERFPWSQYGRAYYKRGSQASLDAFGPTFRAASDIQKDNRKTFGWYGRGRYGIRRTLGKFAKRNRLGKRALDLAIGSASAYAGGGMYTGSGAYRSSGTNNLIKDVGEMGAVPEFRSASDETGELTVTHKEYVRDVYANPDGEDFTVQGLALNPAMEQSFPWLSQVAQNFEEYTFEQLIFTYRSTIADVNSANGQVGTIIMTTNYNAQEPLFRSKGLMMGYAHSSSQKTIDHMLHGVECDPTKISGDPGKYTRNQGLEPNQDIKTYDWGTFQIGIANTPPTIADNTIGELWVSYTVRLRKPKYHTKEGYGISRDIFSTNNIGLTPYQPDSTDLFMGKAPLQGTHNSIGCHCVSGAINGAHNNSVKITFPGSYSGFLEIELRCQGNGFLPADDDNPLVNETITGNIEKIYDLLAISKNAETQAGGPNTVAWEVYAQDPDMYIYKCHIRVDIASNAIDNSILLQITGGNTGGTTFQMVFVDIHEYNSTFGNRASHAPVMSTEAGAVVPYLI